MDFCFQAVPKYNFERKSQSINYIRQFNFVSEQSMIVLLFIEIGV
jgi:hypothetical protein